MLVFVCLLPCPYGCLMTLIFFSWTGLRFLFVLVSFQRTLVVFRLAFKFDFSWLLFKLLISGWSFLAGCSFLYLCVDNISHLSMFICSQSWFLSTLLFRIIWRSFDYSFFTGSICLGVLFVIRDNVFWDFL